MSHMAPWTVAALDVLADGQPHTLDELLAVAGPLIPDERAWRAAETHRTNRPTPRGDRRKGDRATAVATGRRIILHHTLDACVRRGVATRPAPATYQHAAATT